MLAEFAMGNFFHFCYYIMWVKLCRLYWYYQS